MADDQNPVVEEDALTFIPGARGNNQLVHKHFVYIFHRQNANTVRWRCQKREARNGKCPGKLSTNTERTAVLVDSETAHNHGPDKDNLAVRKFLTAIKKSTAAAPGQRTIDVSIFKCQVFH